MQPLIDSILMRRVISPKYCLALLAVYASSMPAQPAPSTDCRPISLMVAPSYDTEALKRFPQRLQVDACPEGLFLVAYASGSSKPQLRVRTFDEFIEQLVSIGRVVAVLTGGGTTSRLWVFDFSGDHPVLSYKGTTKEATSIQTKEPYKILIDFWPVDGPRKQLRFGEEKPTKPVR
jgi:hypothetical protein